MAMLRAMCADAPPLAPETAIASARAAYDQFLRQPPPYANEVEDAIIAYGRILWPYRKAFDVLVRKELGAPADAHTRAPSRTRSATPARGHASSEHAGGFAAMCGRLIAERAQADRAVRAAIAADPSEYQRLIREFQSLQHEIERHIFDLRRLAERAADHPEVFSEIMETVRTFERGLAYLAKEPSPTEVCAAIESYRSRHAEARLRREAESRPRIFR